MRPAVLATIVILVLAGMYFSVRSLLVDNAVTPLPTVVPLASTTPLPTLVPSVTPTVVPTVAPTSAVVTQASSSTTAPATLVPLKPVGVPAVWVQARVLGGGACSPSNMCRVEVMYRVGSKHFVSRVTYLGNRFLFGGDTVTMLVDARTGRCITPCRVF